MPILIQSMINYIRNNNKNRFYQYIFVGLIIFAILANKIGFLWCIYYNQFEEIINFVKTFQKILIIVYISIFLYQIK